MYFPPFITNRLKVQMKELTVADTLVLSQIPVANNEAGLSEFLRRAIEESNIELDKLTVQERYALLVHYLAITNVNEKSVGEIDSSGYLIDAPYRDDCYTFTLEYDNEKNELEMHHLTGDYIEAVERLALGGVEDTFGVGAFTLCMMAAQIREKGTEDVGVIDELLHERVKQLLTLPARQFESLYEHYRLGAEELTHLVNIHCDNKGLIVVKEGEDGHSAARFCFDVVIPERTFELWRQSEK